MVKDVGRLPLYSCSHACMKFMQLWIYSCTAYASLDLQLTGQTVTIGAKGEAEKCLGFACMVLAPVVRPQFRESARVASVGVPYVSGIGPPDGGNVTTC